MVIVHLTGITCLEAPRARSSRVANQVPEEILNDALLNKAIESVKSFLPSTLGKTKSYSIISFRFLQIITLKSTKLFGELEKLKLREVRLRSV